MKRPVALVTGASRKQGIGAAIAIDLAKNGWDVALTYWRDYDNAMPWGSADDDIEYIKHQIESHHGRCVLVEADLSLTYVPGTIFHEITRSLGMVSALILSHCYSVDSHLMTTSVASFDLHFAINTRASFLLIQEFARRFQRNGKPGRIIAMTSDHTAYNLPYGASKGALDRIVIAAAEELRGKSIIANVINPGANDTGWMSEDFKAVVKQKTFQNRIGTPMDTANLVSFLCSDAGEWINGQILYSNGGINWA